MDRGKEVSVQVAVEARAGRKRTVGTVVRLGASVVMLAVLLPRVRHSALFGTWHASTFAWLAGAVVVTMAGIVLSALRWQRVLASLGMQCGMAHLLSHYLAGMFVSNFLPTTIGGDVVRVSRQSAENGDSAGTFASVVLERLTGWLVLPLISLTGLLLDRDLLRLGTATRVVLAVSLGTLLGLGLVLAMAGHPGLGGRLANRPGWRRFLHAVHLGIDRFRRRPGQAAVVLAVGVVYQLAVVAAALMAARALGIDVGWVAIVAFMPAVAMVQVVSPLIGGLGAREGAFVLFLHPLGVPTDQAIALGLLVYGITLAASLLGAPAFAAGSRPARVMA